MYNSIIIGCGFAGAVIARELAEKGNKKVLILEERSHIGGNAYDCLDEDGILIHQYGPHIFHTNEKKVWDYLSRFTQWRRYEHKVAADIYGNIVPIPFNLNTLRSVFKERAAKLEEKLIRVYGRDSAVPIMKMRQNEDNDIKEIAEYVYENIFLKYTMKQWGQTPDQVDSSVTARVPVMISEDDRYFRDHYQGMPLEGYTNLFHNLLNHANIELCLNTKAKGRITVDDKLNKILLDGSEFKGEVVYTGPLDELFGCRFGRLPYRSLSFVFENYKKEFYQTNSVINYTVTQDYTRITEFKQLTGQKSGNSTTIVKEYPLAYTGSEGQIPYYAILNKDNEELYLKYIELIKNMKNFYVLGRLAEYKYYNMDAITLRALELADKLLE